MRRRARSDIEESTHELASNLYTQVQLVDASPASFDYCLSTSTIAARIIAGPVAVNMAHKSQTKQKAREDVLLLLAV